MPLEAPVSLLMFLSAVAVVPPETLAAPRVSDAIWLAVIAAIASVFTTIATLIVSVLNGRKQDALVKKTDEIHESTNGNMTKARDEVAAARADLGVALEKIDGLERLIVGFVEDKKKAGEQIVALASAATPGPPQTGENN